MTGGQAARHSMIEFYKNSPTKCTALNRLVALSPIEGYDVHGAERSEILVPWLLVVVSSVISPSVLLVSQRVSPQEAGAVSACWRLDCSPGLPAVSHAHQGYVACPHRISQAEMLGYVWRDAMIYNK